LKQLSFGLERLFLSSQGGGLSIVVSLCLSQGGRGGLLGHLGIPLQTRYLLLLFPDPFPVDPDLLLQDGILRPEGCDGLLELVALGRSRTRGEIPAKQNMWVSRFQATIGTAPVLQQGSLAPVEVSELASIKLYFAVGTFNPLQTLCNRVESLSEFQHVLLECDDPFRFGSKAVRHLEGGQVCLFQSFKVAVEAFLGLLQLDLKFVISLDHALLRLILGHGSV
jgi:hypothetical protein